MSNSSDRVRAWARSLGPKLAVLLMLASALECSAQAPSPEERFARGKALVDANCGDCRGATRAGLEQGIAEIDSALKDGYPDRVAALRTLAAALNTLQLVHAPPDSPSQREVADRKRAIYRELAQLRPKDPEILSEYAASLEGDEEQIRAYRAALAAAPNHAPAHFALGMLLLRNGATAEAVQELRRAVETGKGYQVEAYGREAEQALIHAGRPAEAAEIRNLVKRRLPPR